MGFHKLKSVTVEGQRYTAQTIPFPKPNKRLAALDAKARRKRAPAFRVGSFVGLAAVAIAGCLAGYALLTQPSMDANALPGFVNVSE